MAKRMMIDAIHPAETRVVIADNNQIVDFDFTTTAKKQLKGNVYLAKVTRVEPSLQAAFVEYGGGKQGFLPFSEIHPDYYQIPVSDKKRLMEEEENAADDDEDEDELNVSDKDTNEPAPAEKTDEATKEENGKIVEAADKKEEAAQQKAEPEAQEKEEPKAEEKAKTKKAKPPASAKEKTAPVPELSEEVKEDSTTKEEAKAEAEQESTAEKDAAESEKPEDDAEAEKGKKEARPRRRGRGRRRPRKSDDESAEKATSDDDGNVETLPSEEEEMQRRKRKNYSRRYKIQEVIRRGQIVLVQVIKEERGNKGVSLTSYLSLAGRYCVLMPNSPKDGGISRKISSADDRKRLKAICSELKLAEGMSVIIRTAGMDRTRAEIKRDYDYLVKVWNGIRDETLKSTAPALVYEESDVIKRAIRDQYSSDIDEIVVEGEEGYQAAKDFMKLLLPSHTPKVKQYNEPTPLFYAFDVEDQLLSMHDPVVKLKSGGYINIDPTEALISIDVNSGRATSERNIEETALKTNLETAAEVARQLRLRDLAGLIVIDFIDMNEARNRRAVERALKDALKMDRAKIQLGRISPFGLLEMSRQRLRPSISETSMVQCGHCVGRGFVRSNESMSIQMIRALEKEASTGNWNGLRLILPQQVALHLLNNKRDMIKSIEKNYNLTIQILIDANMTMSEFNLEKMRRSPSERNQEREKNRGKAAPRKRRGRGKKSEQDSDNTAEKPATTAEEQQDASAEDKPKGRSRRGGRGGRGRGRKPANAEQDNNENANSEKKETTAHDAPEKEQDTAKPKPAASAPKKSSTENKKGGETKSQTNDNTPSDAKKLPAFATEAPVIKEEPKPAEPEKTAAIHAMPATPRDPNAPAKKGWWQKMIQLDD